jgi:FMN-dependent NADH-azoreductase
MSTVLYIKGSPRNDRSHSRAVARAFLAALRAARPEVQVEERNVFEMDLPSFDGLTIQGKYNIMHGRAFTPQEQDAWSSVEALIEDFKSADAYVFAVPMWNFSLPYRLKQYMDVVTQPGYAFTTGPEGYKGLLAGKKAFVCYSSGGMFPDDGNPVETWNFQSSYLRTWFSFIGITDVHEVACRGMLTDGGAQSKERAVAMAEKIALEF